jgi:hypothetical protein
VRHGPAVAGPFDSPWLKWAGAVLNAQMLKDDVLSLAGKPDLRVGTTYGTYYDPQRHRVILVIVEIADPFPVLWGVLLGNIVQSYRSCLDHVAWALYKRGRTPNLIADLERKVYFPIYDDRIKFNKALARKLPGARRADIAIVRRYQPYKPGTTRAHRHVFTVLDALAQHDKHRTIQPVAAVPNRITFSNLRPIDCTITRIEPGSRGLIGTLEPNTELARFLVRKTGPKPDVQMQPHFNFVPAINDRLTLIDFLMKTMQLTGTLLREFSKPPKSVLTLLGEIPPDQS